MKKPIGRMAFECDGLNSRTQDLLPNLFAKFVSHDVPRLHDRDLFLLGED